MTGEIVLPTRFFVRHWREAPVQTLYEDRLALRWHVGMAHHPITDAPDTGSRLRLDLHAALAALPEDGTVFELVLRPAGATAEAPYRIPWVKLHRRPARGQPSYGPNPTGEIEP